MGAVFISYRRGDSEGQARALSLELGEIIGRDSVFMDVDSIALGRDFRQVLQERLQACDVLLALIGPHWIDAQDATGNRRPDSPTDFVRQEIAAALKRNIPVTPVLLQGATMPPSERLPDDLKELAFRNGFELSHLRWESDVREMVKRLGLATAEPENPLPSSAAYKSAASVSAPPTRGAAAASAAAEHRPRKWLIPSIGAGVAILVIAVIWIALTGGKVPEEGGQIAKEGKAPVGTQGGQPPADTQVSFDPIVAGVRQIVLGDKEVAGLVAATAAGWATIASADTADGSKAFVIARSYEGGRVAAFGHPGFLGKAAAYPDNELFIANLLKWLAAGKEQRACFTTSHGEANEDLEDTRATVGKAGFEMQRVAATLNPYTISGCGVLVINNADQPFTDAEVQAVRDHVAKGRGLLLGGLGWAFAQYSPTKNIQDFPMLQIGREFGVEWPTITVPGPDAQGRTVFRSLYPKAAP